MSEVMAVDRWGTNADLIADAVVPLGYLDPDTDRVLDPTWGHGVWWQRVRPARFVASDLEPDKSPLDCPVCVDGGEHPTDDKGRPVHAGRSVDFTALPFDADTFDVVAFDPPYVPVGSNDTSTLKDYNERYGRHLVPSDPVKLQAIIDAGLSEAARVSARVVLVKCANYVWSGHLYPGALHTANAAADLGLELLDWFTHAGNVRAQPGNRTRKCAACRGTGAASGRAEVVGPRCDPCAGAGRIPSTQQHARQNASHLFVYAVPSTVSAEPHPTLFDTEAPC